MSPSLADILSAEIAARGPLSFARFMAAALYEPGLGYYETIPARIGRAGDFFTSASVGPVFGRCLAVRFAAWLCRLEAPRLHLAEAGPHDGRLAADVLEALAACEAPLAARVEYWLLETSPVRRAWQEATLRAHRAQARWTGEVHELEPGSIHGVIFANEFLDALPVHRVGWDAVARDWFEWRVGWDGRRFHWVRPETDCQFLPLVAALREALAREYPAAVDPAVQRVLPDGFTVELHPAATAWWTAAARALGSGWLVAFDYGFDPAETLRPEHPAGTLRAFYRHHVVDDVLARPGQQDLTTHVPFGALIAAGEAAGLRTEGLMSQAAFLLEVLGKSDLAAAWTDTERRQFRTLVHPQHLGERFKVLVQSRLPWP